MSKTKPKKDTIADFIARGGKITVCEPIQATEEKHVLAISMSGPVTILTYDEVELLYGEMKPQKISKSKKPKIKIEDLPESIRNFYLKGLIDE
jgi:hypothetical protein